MARAVYTPQTLVIRQCHSIATQRYRAWYEFCPLCAGDNMVFESVVSREYISRALGCCRRRCSFSSQQASQEIAQYLLLVSASISSYTYISSTSHTNLAQSIHLFTHQSACRPPTSHTSTSSRLRSTPQRHRLDVSPMSLMTPALQSRESLISSVFLSNFGQLRSH